MSSSLHLTIHPSDDAPIYRQIVRQVREAVASGRLASGDRLPSQRELALRLVIAPLTVKKAYDELERDGLIRTARGQGTFVADVAEQSTRERVEALRGLVRKLVHEARLSGLSEDELLGLVRDEANRLTGELDALARREGER